MKTGLISILKFILVGMLCTGLLISCKDDNNNSSITNVNENDDPSYGFLVNSTAYRLAIDLNERETFEIDLAPGAILGMNLKEGRTHIFHVVLLDSTGDVVAEYVNTYYIDEIPLDNQVRNFVCSWYVEFPPEYPEYGFTNNFGT